jgi:hypothetical protein
LSKTPLMDNWLSFRWEREFSGDAPYAEEPELKVEILEDLSSAEKLHFEFDELFENRPRRKWNGTLSKRQEWSRKIRRRDDHLCKMCGGPGEVAHHVIPVREDPDLTLDPDNGITLCRECHYDVHRARRGDENGSPWHY